MKIFLEFLGRQGLPCLTWSLEGIHMFPEGETRMAIALLLPERDSLEMLKVGGDSAWSLRV